MHSRPLYRWKRLETYFIDIMVPIPSQVAEIENLDPKPVLLPITKRYGGVAPLSAGEFLKPLGN